ncbi:DUF935 family protein [Dysgonomonas sp. ZJ279]|uniref:phage portal protein family protein n=1 Tax=Dysgonomonas sp. ZJ279 TaxID=2709796 RepID=UPI0013EAD20F|nr:DUF935 family protein [Dysgonomonas sp. ZJ279]
MARKQRNTSKPAETTTVANHAPTYAPKIARKAISQTRRDIADYIRAKMFAMAVEEPRQYLLQDIYTAISDDALLSSQIDNRKEQTMSAPYEMVTDDNKVDERLTQALKDLPVMVDIIAHILDSENYGSSLIELSSIKGIRKVELINRRNVVPDPNFGRFYPDTSLNTFIEYRDSAEYGKTLLEFNSDHIGRLNKAVPHVLFKRFAQSCWSELCEIYGIPPRVMKTNTQDPAMLDRAESMMRDIGAAAWFIIDEHESFEFANAVNTNGDVYSNLINLCNNEISMLFSGAIIGQDTKNGNESKEKISISILDRLVDSDKRMVEMYLNSVVIPALYTIGWIPRTTSRFRFAVAEDTDKLFEMTTKIMPYKSIDDEWFAEKFGIKVTGDRNAGGANFQ